MEFLPGQPLMSMRLLAACFPTGVFGQTDEQELQLYAHELEAYMDPAMGADKRLAEMHDIANTLLHSYPNALTKCHCQCRTSPFSKSALLSKGLRGYFVVSSSTTTLDSFIQVKRLYCLKFHLLLSFRIQHAPLWLSWVLHHRCSWYGSTDT